MGAAVEQEIRVKIKALVDGLNSVKELQSAVKSLQSQGNKKLGVDADSSGTGRLLNFLRDLSPAADSAITKTESLTGALGGSGLLSTLAPVAGGLAAVAGAGVTLGSIIFALAKGAADYGAELHDMSVETGLSAETLSGLDLQLKQSGASLDDFGNGVFFLQKNLLEAAQGNKQLKATFRDLGISDANAALADTEGTLRTVLQRLAAIPDEGRRNAVGAEVMGRAYKQLRVFIADTHGDIDKVIESARAAGLTMSTQAANAADDFGDSLDELGRTAGAAGRQIGTQAMPMITGAVKDLTKALRENQGAWAAVGTASAGAVALARGSWAGLLTALTQPGDFVQNFQAGALAKLADIAIEQTLAANEYAKGRGAGGGFAGRLGINDNAEDVIKQTSSLVEDLRRQIQFYGDSSAVAATKQRLLQIGVSDANSELARQALAFAASLDSMREQSRAIDEQYQKEKSLFDEFFSKEREAIARAGELAAPAKTELDRFDLWLSKSGLAILSWAGGVQKANTTGKLTQETIDEARRAFADLDKEIRNSKGAEEEKKRLEDLAAQARSAADAVLEMGRDAFKGLRQARYDERGLSLSPLERFLDRLEDVKGLDLVPGSLDGFARFLSTLKLDDFNDELRIAEELLKYLPKNLETAGEVAQTVAHALRNIAFASATNEHTAAAKNLKQLMEELQGVGARGVTLTNRERVEKLLLTDAYKALTAAERDGLRAAADEADARLVLLKKQEEARRVVADLRADFESSFTGMFQHVGEGFDGMVRSFVLSFALGIAEMEEKAAAAKLGKLLFPDPADKEGDEGEAGGGGGLLGALVRGVRRVFHVGEGDEAEGRESGGAAGARGAAAPAGEDECCTNLLDALGKLQTETSNRLREVKDSTDGVADEVQADTQGLGSQINEIITFLPNLLPVRPSLWGQILTAAIGAVAGELGGALSQRIAGDDEDYRGNTSLGIAPGPAPGTNRGPGGRPILRHALGAMIQAAGGGKLIEVAEAGYDELVVTTDPRHRERTANLLADFITRTGIFPNLAQFDPRLIMENVAAMLTPPRFEMGGFTGPNVGKIDVENSPFAATLRATFGDRLGGDVHVHTHNIIQAPAARLTRQTEAALERDAARATERGVKRALASRKG